MSENVLFLIKNNQNISKNLLTEFTVIKDGNCWYRTLSLFFTGDEQYHNTFRMIIYEAAKTNKEKFIPFFINHLY